MSSTKPERCPSCRYGECERGWQSGALTEALHSASILPLISHRYDVDMPDDHCCESSGWCPHIGMGYERDPFVVRCVHCSVPVYSGEGGSVDLADLFRSIADHERTRHSPAGTN